MSNFTVKKDPIIVKLDYVELENGEILILRDEKDKERVRKAGDKKIKTAVAKFDRPRWKNFNQYIRGCVEQDENGIPYLDTITLRDKKLRYLLKELVDGDGNQIKLNNEFFDNVVPEIAINLAELYDEIVEDGRTEALMNDPLVKKIIDEMGQEASESLEKEEKKDLEKEEDKVDLEKKEEKEEQKEKVKENEE